MTERAMNVSHPVEEGGPKAALFCFAAADAGEWAIDSVETLCGDPLPVARKLRVALGGESGGDALWRLSGTVSNLRYTKADEKQALAVRSPLLGRTSSVCASLIPIRKSAAWWALAQDERRTIFEESSRHIAVGLKYLPAIARRLHHSRDLGEPFDFLTWFEFAPEDASAFDDLLGALRATPEWRYVDREIDFRLRLAPGA